MCVHINVDTYTIEMTHVVFLYDTETVSIGYIEMMYRNEHHTEACLLLVGGHSRHYFDKIVSSK